jgi:pentose-5-phosphate-3-epimerase
MYRIAPSILSADFARLGEEIKSVVAAGADLISFHPEASAHVDRTLQIIRNGGCRAGLAFNPASSLDVLDYVIDKVAIDAMRTELRRLTPASKVA